jgi:pyruvate dehydrogenase E1 component
MPDFWEFPTVSMGLGPINSLYQARFNRYLHHRQLDDTSGSRVWCFLGDGECDEPETLGAISLAGREQPRQPDLGRQLQPAAPRRAGARQRQDHPGARGGLPRRGLERDQGHLGLGVGRPARPGPRRRAARQDEQHRRRRVPALRRGDGAYIREHFFGPDPRLRALVEHLSDDELRWLPRGGHDYRKLYAAYKAATETKGRPTVILAKTIKGWTLGAEVEGRNATHQIKKMTNEQLRELRTRLHLEDEIPEEALADGAEPPYFRPPRARPSTTTSWPGAGRSAARSRAVGSRHPPADAARRQRVRRVPGRIGAQAASTTTAFTRLLRTLARDPDFGSRVVPIIPDEARTFGMDSLFREFGIYAAQGQKYEPVDHDLLLSYQESITTARSSRRASPRPGRWRRGSPRPRRTPPAACPWCRSSPSIRCSGSSGWAT